MCDGQTEGHTDVQVHRYTRWSRWFIHINKCELYKLSTWKIIFQENSSYFYITTYLILWRICGPMMVCWVDLMYVLNVVDSDFYDVVTAYRSVTLLMFIDMLTLWRRLRNLSDLVIAYALCDLTFSLYVQRNECWHYGI